MKTQRIQAPEILLCCLLLFPTPLPSQRPQAPGKLSVTSTQPGARITIDGQATNQVTPFTFVVSPDDHAVQLTGVPKCNGPRTVHVYSGSTTSINCDAATGWGNPTTK